MYRRVTIVERVNECDEGVVRVEVERKVQAGK